MDNRQLMTAAVEQHKDTTATAKRALAVVEQTKELQGSTLAALHDQDHQMRRIAADMDRVRRGARAAAALFGLCCVLGLNADMDRVGEAAAAAAAAAALFALRAVAGGYPQTNHTQTTINHNNQIDQSTTTQTKQMGTDISYSQRILRYMSSCCCVAFFCASCVEPQRRADDRDWRQGCAAGCLLLPALPALCFCALLAAGGVGGA